MSAVPSAAIRRMRPNNRSRSGPASREVGSSKTSIEDAINNALAEAAKSIQHLEWFEVVDTRGHIENGAVGHYQVTLKVGFRIANS